MGDLTCQACRERKDTGHTHANPGCLMLSPAELRKRDEERAEYLEYCERTGENPYYDTLEEKCGDK